MKSTPRLINDQRTLDHAFESSPRLIAIDTEFYRRNTYYPIPGLVQCSFDGKVFAVDMRQDLDLTPLKNTVLDPAKELTMHSAEGDLEILQLLFGSLPQTVFDTQLAHAFLTPDAQISYEAIVKHYLNIELDKGQATSNWLKRPLSKKQLHYAIEDVRYLPRLREVLVKKLRKKSRLEWFRAEARAILKRIFMSNDDLYRQVTVSNRYTRRQQALHKQLFAWREDTARRRNLPRTWILSNRELNEIVRAEQWSVQAMREYLGSARGSQHANAIVRVWNSQIEGDRNATVGEELSLNQMSRIVTKMSAYAQATATKLGLAPALLGSKRDLSRAAREYLTNAKLPSMFEGWRYELVGKPLIAILNKARGRGARR